MKQLLYLSADPHLTDYVVSRRSESGEKLYLSISSTFALEMQRNRRISPENSTVQDFFKRCENISQEVLVECLNSLAKKSYPGREEEFISFMLLRIRSIKPIVYRYFGWECP